jgi:hypothetical protein
LKHNLLEELEKDHPLIALSSKIPCKYLEGEFSALYSKKGRKGKPIRLMSGLLILKQMNNISDETVVTLWRENPYWQVFCGFKEFQIKHPCDSSELTYFRKRIGAEGVEKLFAVSVALFGKKASAERVINDTTVQEKNITYPTDAKIRIKIINRLLKLAKANQIQLRRTFTREIKGLRLDLRFFRHVKKRKKAIRATKRLKTIARLKKEFEYLVKRHNPEFMYFVADTFLAMSKRERDEFSEFYQAFKFPFWMNTRAETITEHSSEHLAKMNCLRFNIGIEHGNENFVRKVMNRKVRSDNVVDAFKIAAKNADDYTCVANSIIGVPTETPELTFDTIELNRRLPDEIVAAGSFIFAPFHGTALRELAIEKGYISSDLICTEGSNTSGSSFLNMPDFTKDQINGFMRTFSFYVKFPKNRRQEIDKALKWAKTETSYLKNFVKNTVKLI